MGEKRAAARSRFDELFRAARALVLAIAATAPAGAAALSIDADAHFQPVTVGIASAEETEPGILPPDGAFRPRLERPGQSGTGVEWLRLVFENPEPAPVERVLALRLPFLDRVGVHARLADGSTVEGTVGARSTLGETLAPFPAFGLTFPPGRSTVFLRLDARGAAVTPLELHAPAEFNRVVTRDHLLVGAAIGAGLVLALYLSLSAGGPRDERHAAFLALALAALAHLLVTSGIGKVWFWPEAEVRTLTLAFLSQGLVLGSAAWYFRAVLRTGGLTRRMDRALAAVSVMGYSALLLPVLPAPAMQGIHAFVAGMGPPALFLLLVALRFRGRREAGVLALGWGPATAVTLHWYLRAFDAAAHQPINQYVALAAFAALIAIYARELSREAQVAAVAAEHDPLTGLGNRTRMERGYNALVAARGAEAVAVFQIDLDRFKPLNDTLGHAAGDEALVEVAERFRGVLRADDVFCRVGGDEFVVLIPYTGGPAALAAIAERLIAALAAPIRTSAGPADLGASIGIALGYPKADLPSLLRNADAALYAVKRSGRCGFRFAEPPAPGDGGAQAGQYLPVR